MRTRSLLVLAIAAVMMFAGTAHSATLLSDNFNSETLGLNYTGFVNWNVVNGTVDLIGSPNFFDLLPGNGRYVDLDGSTSQAGTLTSKQSFVLPDGGTFTLSFDLAGSQRGDVNIVDVTLSGSSLLSLTVNSSDPFAPHQINLFNASGSTMSGPLTFHNRGGDNLGAILDNVLLTGPSQAAPEPITVMLLGFGLAGLGIIRRFKK